MRFTKSEAARKSGLKLFFVVFWSVFLASAAVHLTIGDVVVSHAFKNGQNYVMLRGDPESWVPISGVLYFAHQTLKISILLMCLSATIFWLFRWSAGPLAQSGK
jgi:hypothetical protein